MATARPEITALGTGTRDDRTLRSIVVSLPPFIADHSVALDSETAADLEAATSEIAKLHSSHDELEDLGVRIAAAIHR